MTPAEALAVAAKGAQAVLAAADGRPVEAAEHLIDGALRLVPHNVANKLLTDAAIRRANAIADEAERLKFGGG